VQIRCSDKLQSNAILQSLREKGVGVQVLSMKNPKDTDKPVQFNLRRRQYEELERNQWMQTAKKQEEKQ
jgi:hypothetical protein